MMMKDVFRLVESSLLIWALKSKNKQKLTMNA